MTNSVIDAYAGVAGPAPKQYATSASGLRLGPGAAVIRGIAASYLTVRIAAYVGNPHYLYGRAAIALIDQLLLDELVAIEGTFSPEPSFKLRVFCKRAGTDTYARDWIARWKRDGGHKADGAVPRDWAMWDRLNALCYMGVIQFLEDPFLEVSDRIKGLHREATAEKRSVPTLSTDHMDGYEEVTIDDHTPGSFDWPERRPYVPLSLALRERKKQAIANWYRQIKEEALRRYSRQ